MKRFSSNLVINAGTTIVGERKAVKPREVKPLFNHSFVLVILKDLLQLVSEERHRVNLNSLAVNYFNHYLRISKNEGEERTVKLFKALAQWAKTYAVGGKPHPISFRKHTKTGIPCLLSGFTPYLRSRDNQIISVTLTILSFYTSITGHKTPVALSAIEEGTDLVDTNIEEEFASFLKTSAFARDLKNMRKDYDVYGTFLKGSQGIHAQQFYSAPLERHILNRSENKELLEAVKEVASSTQRGWLSHMVDNPAQCTKNINVEELPNYTRKTSIIREPAFKNRIVTAADTWSQNALYSIHKHLMQGLKDYTKDATYRANHVVNLLKEENRNSDKYTICIDIESFTDNLSIKLQNQVIRHIWYPILQENWTRLMMEPSWYPAEQRFLRWKRGQPMGLLSSWACATVTHHLIVEWASKTANAPLDYYLLGDDIVVRNRQLADAVLLKYKELGIPVALQKTIESPSGGFEFVKRIITETGEEITPIPWNILSERKTATKYVELARLLSFRWGFPLVSKWLDPLLSKEVDPSRRDAIRFYTELQHNALSAPVSDSTDGVTPNVPRVINYQQSRFIRICLKNMLVVRALDRLQKFDVDKARGLIPIGNTKRKHKVRGYLDDPTKMLYYITMINYLKQYQTQRDKWNKNLDSLLSNSPFFPELEGTSNYYIDWNLLDVEDPRDIEFYDCDPKRRFSVNKRSRVIQDTLKIIENTINDVFEYRQKGKGQGDASFSLLEFTKRFHLWHCDVMNNNDVGKEVAPIISFLDFKLSKINSNLSTDVLKYKRGS